MAITAKQARSPSTPEEDASDSEPKTEEKGGWEDHRDVQRKPHPGAQTEKKLKKMGWRDDHGKRLREVRTEHSVYSFRTKHQEHTVEQRDMK